MNVSLYSLYCRSRYKAAEDDEEPGCNRKELFAVAAVGFVMEHDKEFKKRFLENICGVQGTNLADYRVGIQSAHCSDLELVSRSGSEAIVIEFKLDADLQSYQDPSQEQFWDAQKDTKAYAPLILERHKGKKLRYIVLQRSSKSISSQLRGSREGIDYRFRIWSQLARNPAFEAPLKTKRRSKKETPLEKDLLDSLGQLGIPELQFRDTLIMKSASKLGKRKIADIYELYRILEAVMHSLGLDKMAKIEIKKDSIGCHLIETTDFKSLKELVQPEGNYIGWFGYDFRKSDNQPRLSIWLYCGSEDARNNARVKLGYCPEGDGYDLIREAIDSTSGDREWFESELIKFRALGRE